MATIRKRSWATAAGERIAWQADYMDQDGRRRHKQFATRKAAAAFLATASYEVIQGTHTAPSSKTTVADAVRFWLEHSEAEGLDRQTLRTYRMVARHHVLPALGRERLAKLTRPGIEKYRDALLSGALPDKKPRSRTMARKSLGCLKAALKEAQRRGLVAQNVAAGVEVGANRSEAKGRLEIGRDVPSPSEITAILAAATGRHRALVVTAVFTGLRASELRALRWPDVDLAGRTLKVRARADIWNSIGRTKSAAGERTVPLAPLVINALKEHKVASQPNELNLVFPAAAGGVMCHSILAREGLGRAQRAAGVVSATGRAKYGPHAFRHFTASWLIDQGFRPKQIMTILGHASIALTFDLYGHAFDLGETDYDKLAAGGRHWRLTCNNGATKPGISA